MLWFFECALKYNKQSHFHYMWESNPVVLTLSIEAVLLKRPVNIQKGKEQDKQATDEPVRRAFLHRKNSKQSL